jgi:hypothetical protein
MRSAARRFLALPWGRSYLAAAVLLPGCVAPGRVTPAGAAFSPAARAELEALASRTLPERRELLRVRWKTDNGQVSVSGNGAVRIAPPDSLRIDVAARLGLGRATVILTGESVAAEPEQAARLLLPDRHALWAVVGVLRLPEGVLSVERFDDGPRAYWRVRDGEGRRTTFELAEGRLAAVSRDAGGPALARLALERDAEGLVKKARLLDYQGGARFEMEITSRQVGEVFADALWRLGP